MSRKSKKEPEQKKMVRWYNPLQLAKTGIQVAMSNILGARSDYRLIESFVASKQEVFDYSDKNELWIDYIADLGDGWNPTYTVACLLAQENIKLQGLSDELKRGDILIMGGDEVYPVASRDEYQKRLVNPYECAFKESEEPHPHVFAVPGNHDWYDGLVSFMRLFCQQTRRRWLGGWQTRQVRSYFALKLPFHWWLLGVDVQLESDIDDPQLEYFAKVAEQIQKGDRVILCSPKPDWIYGNIYDPELKNNIAYLEKKIIEEKGAKVMLRLSGDLHHYRRHEEINDSKDSESRVQMITSGGGGAFLHPTNGPKVDNIRYGPDEKDRFQLKASFPSKRRSWGIAWLNLLFPRKNPGFGLITGAVYTILNWIMTRGQNQFVTFGDALKGSLTNMIQNPSSAAWALFVIVAFIFFTETHKIRYRLAAGIIHGLLHLLAIQVVGYGAVRLASFILSSGSHPIWRFFITILGTFAGGYLLGSFLMGLYLLVSLNVFNRHANEAFSALRNQDYKNLLRIRLGTDGTLTVFPIGIRKVPRKWVANDKAGPGEPKLIPKKSEIKPHLIEGPIRIKK